MFTALMVLCVVIGFCAIFSFITLLLNWKAFNKIREESGRWYYCDHELSAQRDRMRLYEDYLGIEYVECQTHESRKYIKKPVKK